MKRLIKLFFKSIGLRIRHYSEPSYTKIINHLGATIVFDIGANAGQFANSLREHGYKGKIISFEPTKEAYESLLKTSLSDKNWVVHPRAALGDKIEPTIINVAGNKALSSSILEMGETHKESAPDSLYTSKENVHLITVDSIFEKYVENKDIVFLKIDVQGFEEQVLNGAKISLNKIAAIKLELSLSSLYEGDKLYDFYISKFQKLGFKIWDLEPGHRHPATYILLQFDGIFVKKQTPQISS